MGKVVQHNLSSLSYIRYFFSYANFFHNRRHLSNMSENMLEVENTGWGLKEALPEHLPAQDRSPSLYAIPFPLSEVPLKSQPSCFGSVLPQVHHSETAMKDSATQDPAPTIHLSCLQLSFYWFI